jgi:multiple sugar transport system substrate-binding protein
VKRIVICLLALLVATSFVFATGQGEGKAAAKVQQIKYWALFGGSDSEIMELMVKNANAALPNIQTEVTFVTQNYYPQLSAAIAGGTPPDVAISHTRNLPAMASEQLLYTWDEALAKRGISEKDFVPIAWNGGSINGKRYGVPLDVIVGIVNFYNTDLYGKAGLKDEPKSGAEFVSYAKKIKEATGVWGTNIPLTDILLYRYWFSGMYQDGGTLLTPDLKKAAFNSPSGIKSLQFWVDGIYKDKISSDKPMGEGEGFRFGKLGMWLEGVWNINALRQQQNLKWDVFPMLQLFKPGARNYFANSHNFILPRPKNVDTARRDAAVNFVMWMSENTYPWGEKAGMLVARKKVQDDPKYQAYPYMKALITQANDATYPPNIKATNEVQSALYKHLEAAMAQKKTVQQALADAEAEVNKILAQ